jgi:amino acid permease
MAIYITVGLFGYLTFYDDTQGNVLLNYEVPCRTCTPPS